MSIYIIVLGAFAVTLLGGLFALKFKDQLHLVVGFSAGAITGVAFFDLMPEAIELGATDHSVIKITAFIALGFFTYLILDRVMGFHSHPHSHGEEHEEQNKKRGVVRALSLAIHSLLDGVAIGLAFHVAPTLGLVVTVAVLAHDFSDGLNTVSVILKNGGTRIKAFYWLLVDAIAPVVGVALTYFFVLPDKILSLVLALFCGFFLYIGASDLIPDSYHGHPTRYTTFMTVAGALFIFVVINLVG